MRCRGGPTIVSDLRPATIPPWLARPPILLPLVSRPIEKKQDRGDQWKLHDCQGLPRLFFGRAGVKGGGHGASPWCARLHVWRVPGCSITPVFHPAVHRVYKIVHRGIRVLAIVLDMTRSCSSGAEAELGGRTRERSGRSAWNDIEGAAATCKARHDGRDVPHCVVIGRVPRLATKIWEGAPVVPDSLANPRDG